jgi:cell division protease FtsH
MKTAKYIFICCLSANFALQAVSSRFSLCSSIGLATAVSLCAAQSEKYKTKWAKPDWAIKHIPNGVPKELADQVDFIENREKYTKLGAHVPRGMILYGPPGTGKTSIARAIAEKLDVPFIAAPGNGFTAELYGLGSAKVTAFFKAVREEAAFSSEPRTA